MRKIGYIRVSDDEQNLQRQIDSLESICDQVFLEKISAVRSKRPEFDKALKTLTPGDTLVVHDLDRAFRSTLDALTHAENLKARGVNFQIVSLHVDTSTPYGELFYTIAAAFAQFERRILIQRTKEGMAAAQRQGKHIGRPHKLKEHHVQYARRLLKGGYSETRIAKALRVNRKTLLRALERHP